MITNYTTKLEGLATHKIGQRKFTTNQQKLGSLPGIQIGKGNMEIDMDEMPRIEELQRSKGERETLCSWLNDKSSRPDSKGVSLERSCAKEILSFEVSKTTESCKSDHGMIPWGPTMAHQNGLSHVNGQNLTSNELNNMVRRTTLPLVVTSSGAVR